MKLCGLMVVGEGEADRYLKKSLEELERLVDDAVIVLNNADERTKKLVKGTKFWSYEDNREWGKFQPNIKTDLLAKIAKLHPDWIVAIDADEVFTEKVTREELERLTVGAYARYFYVVNLWNSENRYARGLSFWNIRFFKFLPEYGLVYLNKPVHCGLAPPFAYEYGTYAPHILRHYGLMKPEERRRRVDRYKKYDPRAVYKSNLYYDALKMDATGSEYVEEDVQRKVEEEVAQMKNQKFYAK